MKTWILLIVALVISCPALDVQANSRMRRADRIRQIRSMNILDRPYRFGHFYGNTVRRRYHRRVRSAS